MRDEREIKAAVTALTSKLPHGNKENIKVSENETLTQFFRRFFYG